MKFDIGLFVFIPTQPLVSQVTVEDRDTHTRETYPESFSESGSKLESIIGHENVTDPC